MSAIQAFRAQLAKQQQQHSRAMHPYATWFAKHAAPSMSESLVAKLLSQYRQLERVLQPASEHASEATLLSQAPTSPLVIARQLAQTFAQAPPSVRKRAVPLVFGRDGDVIKALLSQHGVPARYLVMSRHMEGIDALRTLFPALMRRIDALSTQIATQNTASVEQRVQLLALLATLRRKFEQMIPIDTGYAGSLFHELSNAYYQYMQQAALAAFYPHLYRALVQRVASPAQYHVDRISYGEQYRPLYHHLRTMLLGRLLHTGAMTVDQTRGIVIDPSRIDRATKSVLNDPLYSILLRNPADIITNKADRQPFTGLLLSRKEDARFPTASLASHALDRRDRERVVNSIYDSGLTATYTMPLAQGSLNSSQTHALEPLAISGAAISPWLASHIAATDRSTALRNLIDVFSGAVPWSDPSAQPLMRAFAHHKQLAPLLSSHQLLEALLDAGGDNVLTQHSLRRAYQALKDEVATYATFIDEHARAKAPHVPDTSASVWDLIQLTSKDPRHRYASMLAFVDNALPDVPHGALSREAIDVDPVFTKLTATPQVVGPFELADRIAAQSPIYHTYVNYDDVIKFLQRSGVPLHHTGDIRALRSIYQMLNPHIGVHFGEHAHMYDDLARVGSSHPEPIVRQYLSHASRERNADSPSMDSRVWHVGADRDLILDLEHVFPKTFPRVEQLVRSQRHRSERPQFAKDDLQKLWKRLERLGSDPSYDAESFGADGVLALPHPELQHAVLRMRERVFQHLGFSPDEARAWAMFTGIPREERNRWYGVRNPRTQQRPLDLNAIQQRFESVMREYAKQFYAV